jgi:hypothetical protein
MGDRDRGGGGGGRYSFVYRVLLRLYAGICIMLYI